MLSSEASSLVLDVALEPLLDPSDSRTDALTLVPCISGSHVSKVPMSGRMASVSGLSSCLVARWCHPDLTRRPG